MIIITQEEKVAMLENMLVNNFDNNDFIVDRKEKTFVVVIESQQIIVNYFCFHDFNFIFGQKKPSRRRIKENLIDARFKYFSLLNCQNAAQTTIMPNTFAGRNFGLKKDENFLFSEN